MVDFLVALGLVLVIEGLLFAALPSVTKRAMVHILEAPESALRVLGIVSAAVGLAVIWLMRG
jgi:uncharacterized protein YjeT (DUF2065 family)